MNTQQFCRLFPLGSHLCREPMPPMPELKRDMENLRRHGFNLVKLQEHWAVDEPREGQFDFSRCEELIAHAAGLDMGVYLGLTCEQAPAWLWRKHPGCRMVRRDGLAVAYEAQFTLPADGKPGPCLDHPGAMAEQIRFVTRLVQTLGRFENIVVWNTWQEVGYWGESDALVGQAVCYCEHTLAMFRAWLAERFESIDALNRAWNTRYGDWADILPTRSARGRDTLPQDVAWGYFMANVKTAHTLRARADAIRAADPLGRPVFAHKAAPAIGWGSDWTLARCQDFLGSSTYPSWSPVHAWDDLYPAEGAPHKRHPVLLNEMWQGLALTFDYVRSVNEPGRPVWAAEFQGGPVSTGLHKSRVPSGDDLRRWMLSAAGSGVTGICFWVTRAEIAGQEANGFSLLDSEGDTTERFEEAARVGRALGAHPELFAASNWAGGSVGILIDEWNAQFCNSLTQGGEHLAYDVRGWHRLLWDLGIPVDFIEMSHWDDQRAAQHRALVLPFPLTLPDSAAGKLRRYVEGGGNLICEAGPGRYAVDCTCTRGEMSAAARELFGARHRSWTMVREPAGRARWSPRERSWGDYADPAMLMGAGPLKGTMARANVYVQTFTPAGATACLLLGETAAGTVHRVGQGRAWLLGTYLGHSGAAHRDESTPAFVRMLLAECGAKSQSVGRLLLRRRIAARKQAWIFTNPAEHTVTEQVNVAGWEQVGDLLGGKLDRRGGNVELAVPSLDVRVLVVANP